MACGSVHVGLECLPDSNHVLRLPVSHLAPLCLCLALCATMCYFSVFQDYLLKPYTPEPPAQRSSRCHSCAEHLQRQSQGYGAKHALSLNF